MFIDQFYNFSDGRVSFSRRQGSDFAKQVADDFNPLHDVDAKRFVIPGDLLFAIVLARYGLNRHMEFGFRGMVLADTELVLPAASAELALNDSSGKQYVTIVRSGDSTEDAALIDNLTRNYVEFSGHAFPHLLVPMLAEQNVMINPDRPVVMYESMKIDLDRLDIRDPALQIEAPRLTINGKRGEVLLAFSLTEAGTVVGRGNKRLLLGGLREYDQAAMDGAITSYKQRKMAFLSS